MCWLCGSVVLPAFCFLSHPFIAAAVGVDVFRPDAHALVELLILIGSPSIYLPKCP